MARLVVVGLPGVGKSSVAATLAARWNVRGIDTDAAIAELVHVSAAAFLREHGESAFRALELDVLAASLAGDVVVATGAGVVTTPEARTLLRSETTLWLDGDDEVLLERLLDGDRPLLGGDHARALAALRVAREPWYREVAKARIDATGTLDEVTTRVIEYVTSGAS